MQAFQTGKMGVAEGIAIIFFLLMPRLFLSRVAELVENAGQVAWLVVAIDAVYPFTAAFMLCTVMSPSPKNFFEICQKLLGKPAAFLVCMYYIFSLAANSSSLLRQYCENTITTALPDADIEIIALLYLVTIAGLCWMGAEAVARSGMIVLPVIVVSLLFIMGALYPFYGFYNLSPWRGYGVDIAIRSGISEAGLNMSMIAVFIFWPAFQTGRTVKKVLLAAFGFSVFLKVIFYVVFVLAFGMAVSSERAMPFYEMAKLVYINPYVQRVESFFIVDWCWIGILAVSLNLYAALYLCCQIFHLPDIRPLIVPAVFTMGSISLLPENLTTILVLDRNLVHVANIGIYIVPTLLFILFKLKQGKRINYVP